MALKAKMVMFKKYIFIYIYIDMHTQISWMDDQVQDSREISRRLRGRGD